MRKPGGYFIQFDPAPPGGMPGTTEYDTFTCAHSYCGGRVVFVKPMMDPAEMGGYCRKCMKLICSICANSRFSCDPLEAQLERWEKGEPPNFYRLRD